MVISKDNWKDFFYRIDQPMFVLDPSNTILAVNKAFQEFCGLSEDEIRGNPCVEPISKETSLCSLTKRINKEDIKETVEIDTEAFGKYLKMVCTPVFDEDNNLDKIFNIIIDLTERKEIIESLVNSEKIYTNLIENISEAIFNLDSNGNIVYISPVVEKITGYTVNEIKGQNFTIFVHPEDRDKTLKSMQEALSGKDEPAKFRIIDKKGKELNVETLCNPLIENDTIIGVTGTLSDITHRKRVERELIDSEENLRFITNNMTDVIGQLNMEGNITYFSPSLRQLTGYEPQELVGKGTSDLVHPEDQEKVLNGIQDGIFNRNPITVEYRTKISDGSYLWVESKGKPVYDIDGNFKSAVFVVRDISDRKKIEEELLFNNTLLEAQLNSTPAGILVVDDESNLILMNNRFKDYLNIPDDIIDSEDDIKIFKYSLNQFKDPKDVMEQIKHLIKHKNERLHDQSETIDGRVFDRYSSPLIDKNGQYYGRIYYLSDITPLSKAENKIKNSLKEKEIINQVIMQLVEVQKTSEIYSIIGKSIKNLLPCSYVLISTLDSEMKNFQIVEAFGLENKINTLKNILGTDLYKMKFPMFNMTEEDREKYQSAQLISFENGFYDLTVGMIPRPICKIIEKVLNVGKIYSIGFSREGTIYGSLNIILPKGQELVNKDVIETILHQGSITIQRQRAEELIKTSLLEKEVLLREIHHRVKNNLQIISSLLDLQEDYVSEDATAVNVLKESQNRVLSMAMIHEMIYQSEDLSHINFSEYIRSLTSNLLNSYGKSNVITRIDVEQIYLNIETSIPLGLLITEIISNSLKYAFPEGEGKITVEYLPKEEEYELIISDNGIGIPEDIDFNNQSTLGLRLVKSLVNQLDGTIQLDRTKGTQYTIKFKEQKYKTRF
ncbi:MAG: PAS domain S-box protein [Methanobacterium sp.]|nr:PAS domain S-box protein [Methanobacterium sp.]